MTLEAIDADLLEWDRKRAVATQNVVDLINNTTYKRLTGAGGFASIKLTGITEARCTPALKALSQIWELFAQIGTVLDQAHDLRQKVRGIFNADQLLELQKLLTGPSVKITVQVDFGKRSLLTPAEVSDGLTLDRVMNSMIAAYDEGKSLIVEVEQAQAFLQQSLVGSIDKIQALQTSAQKLGEGLLPELTALDTKVNEYCDQILSDPLGMKANFERDIAPLLNQASDRISGIKAQFDQVERDLAHAHDTLASLLETHKKAEDAYTERQLKVLSHPGEILPRPPEAGTITSLQDWLGRLDVTMSQGKWKPLSVGVANWSIQATERLHACQVAYAASLELLNKRRDLRDYLGALRTKAQTYGRSEDMELAKIEQAARALLYTRPTDLIEAEKLVKSYAANVS